MRASRTTPETVAEGRARDFATQINRQLMTPKPKAIGAMGVTKEPWGMGRGRATVWTAHSSTPFTVSHALLGSWELHLRWRWLPILGKGASLIDSSISLNVELPDGPPLDFHFPRQAQFCLIRYDFEATGVRRGLHMNVWQPAPVNDNAHWRVFPPNVERATPWNAQRIVDYLISSEVEQDLLAAQWPAGTF